MQDSGRLLPDDRGEPRDLWLETGPCPRPECRQSVLEHEARWQDLQQVETEFSFRCQRGDAVRPKSHYPQHCQQREVNASVGSHGPITLKNAGGKLLEVFELLEHGQSQEERAPAPSSVALALPRNDPAVTRTRVSSLLKTVIVLNQPFVLPSFPASHLLSVAA